MISGCYENLGRIITGNKIVERLKKEKVRITSKVYNIIDDVLNEYRWDVRVGNYPFCKGYAKILYVDFPCIEEIYKKVKQKLKLE